MGLSGGTTMGADWLTANCWVEPPLPTLPGGGMLFSALVRKAVLDRTVEASHGQRWGGSSGCRRAEKGCWLAFEKGLGWITGEVGPLPCLDRWGKGPRGC